LTGKYNNTNEAMQGIAKEMQDFYETKYPAVAKGQELQVRNAVLEVQRVYRDTIFPEMKVDWQTHPNNIGHLYFAGCFRCHDGQHVNAQGKVVPKDCDTCHTVFDQQENGASVLSAQKQGFQHPQDIGDLTQVSCNDCHTGGVGP